MNNLEIFKIRKVIYCIQINFTLKLLLIGIIALWSCGNESKTITEKTEVKQEEVKKDSCEEVSLMKIIEKAPFKNLREFVLDSTFNFETNMKKWFTQQEFNCLKMSDLKVKDIYFDKKKTVSDFTNTLKFYPKKYYLLSAETI